MTHRSLATSAVAGFVGVCTAALLFAGAVGADSAALPAGNLVKNPGGEAPLGGDYFTRNIAPAAWEKDEVAGPDGRVGQGVQVVRYAAKEANGILGKARATAIGGGANYFSGGYPSRASSASQVIDVGSAASDIDAGGVKVCASAYLGGTRNSNVTARLDVQLLGEGDAALGQLRVGPVTRGQRSNDYALLYRAAERTVPARTRSLRVSFTSEVADNPSNLGFADNIAVALTKGRCTSQLAVRCQGGALLATVTPSDAIRTQRVRFQVKGAKGQKVATDARAPYTARVPMTGLSGRLTVTATLAQAGSGNVILTTTSRRC